ncbi:MAG: hypothetical protein IPL46_18600 [Saprospiraceae bacterium]|nr:hypothetical protein [Saprospiraceae bacterium]
MRVIILCFLWSTIYSQTSIEGAYIIDGCAFKAVGGCSGVLLQLITYSGENWIRLSEGNSQTTLLKGTIGFTFGAGVGNLLVRNNNQGAGDLLILEGGYGGRLWLYPDGKLYANNLGNIEDQKHAV